VTTEEYKIVRKSGMDLAYKILDTLSKKNKEMQHAGKLLGFWDGKAMIFDSEEEVDVLMDFVLYEKNNFGIKLIDKFYDSAYDLSEIEEEILEGMVDYHSSLFQIKSIDSVNCIITLIDLFDKKQTEFKLMDLGISKTGSARIIFYTRLIPIRDVYMTSGVSFGFDASVKNKILSDISLLRFKLRRKMDSSDLFILTHKASKQYGLEIVKMDAK